MQKHANNSNNLYKYIKYIYIMHITANHCIELTCAQYVNDYLTSVKFLFSHPFESWTGIYITHAHKALGNRN